MRRSSETYRGLMNGILRQIAVLPKTEVEQFKRLEKKLHKYGWLYKVLLNDEQNKARNKK